MPRVLSFFHPLYRERAPQPLDPVLCLQQPWLDHILEGRKTLEIRHQGWTGTFWLFYKGKIHGRATLEAVEHVTTMDRWRQLQPQHLVNSDRLPHKKTYALRITNVERFEPFTTWRPPGSQGRFKFVPLDSNGAPMEEFHPKARRPAGKRKRKAG